MRDKFSNFMYGRNGTDELSKFLVYVSLALLVINLFVRSQIIIWIVYALLIYSVYRMFSRNIAARSAENRKFLDWKSKVGNAFSGQSARLKEMKSYHIYKCPHCGQKIRIPRGKGKIVITCPKCRTEFQKIS